MRGIHLKGRSGLVPGRHRRVLATKRSSSVSRPERLLAAGGLTILIAFTCSFGLASAGQDPVRACSTYPGDECVGYTHHFSQVEGWYGGSPAISIETQAQCADSQGCARNPINWSGNSANSNEVGGCLDSGCPDVTRLYSDDVVNEYIQTETIDIYGVF
jgi:hypothetical protein